MTTNRGRLIRAAAVLGLAAMVAGTGHAQNARNRNILVSPEKTYTGESGEVNVRLRLELQGGGGRSGRTEVRSGGTVEVGQRVQLCFTANEDGYVTVWSRDAEGGVPIRIYPNEYARETADLRGGPVEDGEEICLGDGDDGFRLTVARPLGEAMAYVQFTQDEDDQFDEDAFPQVEERSFRDARRYASDTVRYRVVQ